MSNSSFFGYSYFSGANCFVKINGIPALEMAGISYQVQESTSPIYGYSSRIFDAVAMGQKLVRGNFVINFISPNYLARIIDSSRASINLQAVTEQYTKYGKDDMDNLVSANQATAQIAQVEAQRELLKTQLAAAEIQRLAEVEAFSKAAAAARSLLEGTEKETGVWDQIEETIYDQQAFAASLESSTQQSTQEMLNFYEDFRIPLDYPEISTQYERFLKETDLNNSPEMKFYFLEQVKKEIFTNVVEREYEKSDRILEESEKKYMKKLLDLRAKKEYYERVLEMQPGILDANSRGNLLEDYNTVDESLVDNIEMYKKTLDQYRSQLENENKTLVEKEIETRRNLENTLKKLKSAKTIQSKNKVLSDLKALENATNKYYTTEDQRATVGLSNTNDIGLLGPFNIDIQFAEEYTITIVDAFLTTRGSMIQIDENAIVEEYSFFARDIKYN